MSNNLGFWEFLDNALSNMPTTIIVVATLAFYSLMRDLLNASLGRSVETLGYFTFRAMESVIVKIVGGKRSKKRVVLTRPENIDDILNKEYEKYKGTHNAIFIYSIFLRRADKATNSASLRAGVFLFIGVVIAIGGVITFWSIISTHGYLTDSALSQILSVAPSFGILIFIEFVAIFFLRQFRITMDDYRYLYSIKRAREDNLIILLSSLEENKESVDWLFGKMNLFYEPGYIKKGDTNEYVEIRKLQRDEYAFIENMMKLFNQRKS